jgi:peptidoglycan/xylan/chitin deacetylase (PgdA/CDA1 family)
VDVEELPTLPVALQRMQRAVDAFYRLTVGALTSVETTEPLVALTFDDGPDPTSTPDVLRVLERYGAQATFFMVGAAAHRHRALVRQVAVAGPAIANHSWDHASFTAISGRQRRTQLRWCQRAISPYGARLFRPPYGHQHIASHLDARLLGLQVVGWSLDVDDWLEPDPAVLLADLTAGVVPGSIVLLHDSIFRGEPDQPMQYGRGPLVQALEAFLAGPGRAFRYVTIPELLAHGRPIVEEWASSHEPDEAIDAPMGTRS